MKNKINLAMLIRSAAGRVGTGLFVLTTLALANSASAGVERPHLALSAKKRSADFRVVNARTLAQPAVARAPLAPDAGSSTNYVFATATNASFTSMTGSTQLIAASQDDVASSNTPIGFEFWLHGVRYTQFSATSNGFVGLSSTGGAVPNNQYSIANGTAALPLLTGCGGDLETGTAGKVHYKVTGAAPNRILTVEFLNMGITYNNVTSDGTFQVRLHETTGQIEFVYGAMARGPLTGAGVGNGGNLGIGYSVAAANGSLVSIVSASNTATTTTPFTQQSYATGSIANLDSPGGDGTRRIYSLTPPVPTAPTSLLFSGVTASTMTLNWTDSPDEQVYAIYRSTDGINYSFFGTTAQNVTTINATGLNPSTTYFWQVYSVSEGAFSSALAGSQATGPAGNIVSTAAGGNWSNTATWVGGIVPTGGDNVTIVDGATVTIDVLTATCLNLTVGQGTSGILQYITTPASTLTVNGNATVAAGGSFTAGTGTLTTHVLNIGGNTSGSGAAGNLTVDGTLDLNTTAGVTTNFFGSSNGTVSGAGATCDFFAIVMQKGTSQAPVLDVTRLITMNAPAASANRLAATNGTFKLSSASVLTPWFGSQTLAATTGRIWLNNAGASTTVVGVGTGTGAGAPTINGTLQVDHGTFGYGSGNNTMTVGAAGSLAIGGSDATVNMFGAVSFTSGAVFTMTDGKFNVNPQATNNLAAATNVVRFNANTINFTGGTLTIVNPHNAASATGKELSINTNDASPMNFQGSTIKFGDGVSSLAGSTDGFEADTFVGNDLPFLGNVVIDNPATNAATRFFKANTALAPLDLLIGGNLTVTNAGGSAIRLNGNLVGVGGDVVNNGTLDGTLAGSRLYFLGIAPQTYSGAGTVTAPLASWDLDNSSGVTIDPGVLNVVTSRVIFFDGNLTNSNKLTLGNGGATSGTLQYGNTTTPTPSGNFDVAPTFNLGTAGEIISYLRTGTSRVTGVEINPTRTLASLTYDDNDTSHTLTVTGGDLTVTTTAALTNGRVVTGGNNLIIATGGAVTRTTGYVDGNLRKTYSAAASQAFEVGTANGYSPATINATAGTFPATLTVKATQGQDPNYPPGHPSLMQGLQRFWTVADPGMITADITLTYLDPDVVGVESDYNALRFTVSVQVPVGSSVTPATNTISVPGVVGLSGEYFAADDGDADGMTKSYEAANGLSDTDATDAAGDLDGDGQSNYAEYLNSTDPQDATKVLAITSAVKGGGQYTVNFNAVANKTYRLQYKDNINDANWLDVGIADLTPAVTGSAQFFDNTLGAQTKRFYHVKLQSP